MRKCVRWDLSKAGAMAQAIKHVRIPFCITDPNLPDNPIVFVNSAFLDLTGYSEDEVIGRNCRFLQGEGTTTESVAALQRAIRYRSVATTEIVNYRKDGSNFVNALQIGPILDDDGGLKFFFGSQLDVTEKRAAERRTRELADKELVHRLRNIVNVMGVVIRMTAREETDPKVLAAIISERLLALSNAHLQTIDRPNDLNLSMEELANSTLLSYAPLGSTQFDLQGPVLHLPAHLLSCLALVLHELATNSVKHGSLGAEMGSVKVVWGIEEKDETDYLMLNWFETGGPKVSAPVRSSGSRIVSDLTTAVGGSLVLDWVDTGLVVNANFPLTHP